MCTPINELRKQIRKESKKDFLLKISKYQRISMPFEV